MEQNTFKNFIELVTFDQSLYQTEKEKTEISANVERIASALEQLEKRLGSEEEKVRHLRKDVDIRELEMKVLSEQEAKTRQRLDTVSNEKEYRALKDEIARLKQKQHDYEATLMKVWKIFEAAQKTAEEERAGFMEEKASLEKELSEKKERLAALQVILDHADQERKTKEQDVPVEWLEKYGRMRNAVMDPVVKIENNSCSVCYFMLPHHDVLRALDHELIQCKDCYRLLYQPHTTGSEASADE